MAISPDGRSVVTGGYDGTIREWDPATGRQRRLIGQCSHAVQDLALTPDGKGLVTGSYDRTCRLWDMASGKELRRFDVYNGWISYVAVSPDGQSLYSSMKIFDLATGRLKGTLLDAKGREHGNPNYLQGLFTADASGVLARTPEGVQFYDAASGRLLGLVAQPPQGFYALALSDDGRFLATGGEMQLGAHDQRKDYSIRLWEVASGQEVTQLGVRFGSPLGPTNALAFSHDGRWLASGGARGDEPDCDLTLRLWDLVSLVPRYRLQGYLNSIDRVAFSPDDRWLASASQDATVLIWDTSRLAPTPRPVSSTALDLGRAWSDLAGDDAAWAYRTVWTLAADPERAVPYLAERLTPITPDDLANDTSLGPIARGETLRRLRAIAALEKIATPEARRILERLASGVDGARETRDAKAAVRRLK
jgi:hypothetical protein